MILILTLFMWAPFVVMSPTPYILSAVKYNGYYYTQMKLGSNNISNFCVYTHSPYTFVPLPNCTNCAPWSFKYSCIDSCRLIGSNKYIQYDGDYRIGTQLGDHLSPPFSSSITTVDSYIEFIGVYDELTSNSNCDSVIGLNVLQSASIPSLFAFSGYFHVIGLHLPHGVISLSTYLEKYMNGTIEYVNIFMPGNSNYVGWNIYINKVKIFGIESFIFSGSYLSIDTSEYGLAMPYDAYHNLYNALCQTNFTCLYTNDGRTIVGYDIKNFKNIEIVLSSKYSLILYPKDYLSEEYSPQYGSVVTLNVTINEYDNHRWVIGNKILSRMDIVLDADKMRIGFLAEKGSHMMTILVLIICIAGSIVIVLTVFLCVYFRRKSARKPLAPIMIDAPQVMQPMQPMQVTPY